jgi:hypothetical protein
MSDKNKSVKSVGAPQKPVRLPQGSFTVDKAIALNTDSKTGKLKVCKLTIRKRITAALKGFYMTGTKKAGNLRKIKVPITHKLGEPIPQPNGKVGRPSYRIVPVNTPVKATKPAPAKKVTKTAPVVNVTAPAPTPDVVPTPAVTTPVVVPTVS